MTEDKIVIGYGDDAGFPTSPGLSHETSDAMKAMIDWCNAQGGINGRQLVGNYYDAAITNVVNAMTQACGEVFMLVGNAWALDSAQEETRLGCGLPSVPTYSVSPEFANAPLTYQAVPNPADIYTAGWGAQIAELFPDEVKNASVMYGNFAATIDTKDKVVQAYPEYGWEFLDCPQEYDILGVPDWKPFAQWTTTGIGDNVYQRTVFTPFEQADSNPATQQYLDILEESGGDVSQLGQQTTSSFLLWATAAQACGADLTRQCVLDELSGITSWDGGGLHAETNPGENLPPQCEMILKLEGTEWVQASPEEEGEMLCNPDGAVELTGRVVDQAELDENRISTKYQQ